MNTFAVQSADIFELPKLRLLPSKPATAPHAEVADESTGRRPALELVPSPASELHPVLVAGGDAAGRSALLDDLVRTMPPSTTFAQAGAVWEVLVRAPSSSMVILAGELDDVPAESLMQMLAHRHPGLPVVSLDAPTPQRALTARA
jgi:hypothetical protein